MSFLRAFSFLLFTIGIMSLSFSCAPKIVSEADKYLREGKYEKAIELYEKASAEKPEDLEIKSKLCKAYFNYGLRNMSKRAYREALRVFSLIPKEYEGYKKVEEKMNECKIKIASRLAESGEYKDAIILLEEIPETDVNYSKATADKNRYRYELAKEYYDKENFAEAVKLLQKIPKEDEYFGKAQELISDCARLASLKVSHEHIAQKEEKIRAEKHEEVVHKAEVAHKKHKEIPTPHVREEKHIAVHLEKTKPKEVHVKPSVHKEEIHKAQAAPTHAKITKAHKQKRVHIIKHKVKVRPYKKWRRIPRKGPPEWVEWCDYCKKYHWYREINGEIFQYISADSEWYPIK